MNEKLWLLLLPLCEFECSIFIVLECIDTHISNQKVSNWHQWKVRSIISEQQNWSKDRGRCQDTYFVKGIYRIPFKYPHISLSLALSIASSFIVHNNSNIKVSRFLSCFHLVRFEVASTFVKWIHIKLLLAISMFLSSMLSWMLLLLLLMLYIWCFKKRRR